MEIGKNYCVTFGEAMFIGTLSELTSFGIRLDPCVFVADTGRRHRFFRDGRADGMEIEAETAAEFPRLACKTNEWPHAVPVTT